MASDFDRITYFARELHPLEPYNGTPYIPIPYVATENVQRQHNLPRFGHTNDFSVLLDGVFGETNEGGHSVEDYIVGVIAVAILIFCVTFVWFMVIVGLKIAGQERVGFLAGRLRRPPPKNISFRTLPEIEEEQIIDESENQMGLENAPVAIPLITGSRLDSENEQTRAEEKFNKKVTSVRWVFALSGIIVIIGACLFYGQGVSAFRNSLKEIYKGLDLVQETCYKAINLTDALIGYQNQLESSLNDTRRAFGYGIVVCNATIPAAEEINEDFKQIVAGVGEMHDTIYNGLVSFEEDLMQIISYTEHIQTQLDSANIFFYIMTALSTIEFTLIICMLAGTYFAAKEVSNCFTKFITNAVILPIFILFMILSWVFSTLFLVTSLVSSDFCIDPDAYVEEILRKYEDQFGSTLFDIIIYYISGCQTIPSGNELQQLSGTIREVSGAVHNVSEVVANQTIEHIEEICGVDYFAAAALQTGAEILHNATHAVDHALNSVREILSCGSFNPIYTSFVHDAFCIQGVDGLSWIYSMSLIVAVFCMMMLMFRAALHPVQDS